MIKFLLLILIFTSCAGSSQSISITPPRTEPVVTRPAIPVDTGMDDGSVQDSEVQNTPPQTVTPIATTNPAAESLVNSAITKISANDLNSAEWDLEEALRLAPSYGPAYYWMAKIKYLAHDLTQAQNFLNKAATLAPPGSEWQQRVESLRSEILGSSPQ